MTVIHWVLSGVLLGTQGVLNMSCVNVASWLELLSAGDPRVVWYKLFVSESLVFPVIMKVLLLSEGVLVVTSALLSIIIESCSLLSKQDDKKLLKHSPILCVAAEFLYSSSGHGGQSRTENNLLLATSTPLLNILTYFPF